MNTQRYQITQSGMLISVTVDGDNLQGVQLDCGGLSFVMSITVNSNVVKPKTLDISTDQSNITMTLGLPEGHRVVYTLSLNQDGLTEHVLFKHLNGKPDDVEIRWTCDFGSISIMPVPFGNHDLKPTSLNAASLKGNSVTCEGAIVLDNGKGVAVAKHPSNCPPVWVKVAERDNMMQLSAAAFSANRGYFDEIDCNDGWHTIDFHPTEYIVFDGGVEQGFYAYRRFMVEHGVTMPDDYDPPINYCVYYESSRLNHQSAALNAVEIRGCKAMDREFIHQMADVAKSVNCNLIYLDQGWDTHFGSLVWDSDRLGDTAELVSQIKEKGLDIGILVELHSETDKMNEGDYLRGADGQIINGDPWHKFGVCACGNDYSNVRFERLKALSDAGIAFFSYDFHNYTPCYSIEHGHSIPSTPFEHAVRLAENQARVKEAAKGTLIESHDWLDCGIYFYPVYMFGDGHHDVGALNICGTQWRIIGRAGFKICTTIISPMPNLYICI